MLSGFSLKVALNSLKQRFNLIFIDIIQLVTVIGLTMGLSAHPHPHGYKVADVAGACLFRR